VLEDAAVASVAEMAPDRIQEALGRLKARRSARTCNHALGGVKAFATWLEHSNRIAEVPRGLLKIPKYNEEADRRLVRRAITEEELARLLAAAEGGPTLVASRPGRGRRPDAWITGPQRATLYRLAMGTGFRADELRTLTPERFALDGPEPSITVLACYAKNGREAAQPITRELAAGLRPYIASCEPGRPVIPVPEKTAKMLRVDLAAAGIPCGTRGGARRGVVDFHALRHSYITHLIRRGVNPKVVQALARHSTITLTLDRYTHLDGGDIRGALEGGGPPGDGPDPALR
jgi:integrase